LQHKYEKVGEEEVYLQEYNEMKTDTKNANIEELNTLISEHDFEKLTQDQYQHMVNRLKKDLISSQLRSQELKDSLKQKDDLVTEQSEY